MPPSDILIFGEDDNDRRAIAALVKALMPTGTKSKVTPIRKPIILSRDAKPEKRRSMAEAIASIARGLEKGNRLPAIVVHRDCDAVEPAHIKVSISLEKDLERAGVKKFAVATPAWEIESWWMLFPKALSEARPAWTKVDYGQQHVGGFENAKEKLVRDLRPRGKHATCPDFRESDGIKVAELIAKDKSHLSKINARSDSFTAFCKNISVFFEK